LQVGAGDDGIVKTRKELVRKSVTLAHLIEQLEVELVPYLLHRYGWLWQADQYKQAKKSLEPGNL